MPFFMASSALFATWFGSETILGSSSEFFEHGLIGVVEDPFGAALCLVLIGLFFAKRLYNLNIRSFGDFYLIRYGKRVELIASLCIVLSYFGWIAAQLVALGVLFESIMGISREMGMVIGALVVCFYTWFGGLWAVAITDTVQTIVIIVGLLIIAILITLEVPDLSQKMNDLPKDYFRFYPVSWKESFTYFAAWITIGLGSIPQQDVFQRVMASKNEKVAVSSSILAGIMYLSIGLIPIYIVMVAKVGNLHTDGGQNMIPDLVLFHGNTFIQVIFSGALISAILSTSSGAILAPATVLEENILNRVFNKNSSDKKRLKLVRYMIVLIAMISLVMAFVEGNIYDLVASSSALSLVSLFIPLVMGLFLKSKNEMAALLSICFGMLAWVFFEYICPIDFPSIVLGLVASMLGWLIGELVVRSSKKTT